MAGHAHDAAVSPRFPEKFPGLFELESLTLMTIAASRLVNPRVPVGIANIEFGAMALDTCHASGQMDVSLALGSDSRMTGVTSHFQRDFSHSRSMSAVHGMRQVG